MVANRRWKKQRRFFSENRFSVSPRPKVGVTYNAPKDVPMKPKSFYLLAIALLVVLGVLWVKGGSNLPQKTTWNDEPDALWQLPESGGWEIVEEVVGPDLQVGAHPQKALGRRIVTLQKRQLQQSLVIHFPFGVYSDRSLPCILVPSGGGNLITGTVPTTNREMMNPYLKRGFIVISYELCGAIEASDARDRKKLSKAYRDYLDVKSGLVNSRNAMDYAIEHLKLVDPNKVFIAGYSSGGSQALLFAAHEPRLAGCVAYCPDTHFSDFDTETLRKLDFLPGIEEFVIKAAPMTHVSRITCPVFLFGVMDDEIIPFEEVEAFYLTLRETNPDVMLRWSEVGGHGQPYRTKGRELGGQWIQRIADRNTP